jgi:hypothetical protein
MNLKPSNNTWLCSNSIERSSPFDSILWIGFPFSTLMILPPRLNHRFPSGFTVYPRESRLRVLSVVCRI